MILGEEVVQFKIKCPPKMPKLHNVGKKFLKKQGFRQCLVISQKIQGQDDKVVNNGESNGSNGQHGGGKSLINGNKLELEKSNANLKSGVKRSHATMTSSLNEANNGKVNQDNHSQGLTGSTTTMAAAAGASVNLVRRNQNMIWVRVGATDHPAFELYNPDNPDNNGSTVWVEYNSNGMKECVARSQITHGLQDRKRHRPTYY